MTRNVSLLVPVALLALALPIRILRVDANARLAAADRYEASYILPSPPVLRVLSLGYREALADLLWCKALVYYGDEILHHGELDYVFAYAEAAIALDPDFKAPYRWVATAGLYHTRAPEVADGRRAVRILERAVARWPEDGEMAWELGATLSYELAPMLHGAAKRQAQLRGAQHLEAAARLGHGPDWLVFTNAATLHRLGQTEQAIRHLEEMYTTIRDPAVRADIVATMSTLRHEREAEAIREATREFEASRRAEYPYVPETLYPFLAPRFDWDATWRDRAPRESDDEVSLPEP